MIKIKGARTPDRRAFVLVPTIAGTVFPYMEIVKKLGPTVDCWGLRNRPSKGTLSETAELHLEPLRRLDDEGYRIQLIGWSYGGVLAYEICSQLERAGIRPGSTFILDCPLPASEDAHVSEYAMMNKFYEMVVEGIPDLYYETREEIFDSIREKGFTYPEKTMNDLFESYVSNFARWRTFEATVTRSPVYLVQATIQVFPKRKMDIWAHFARDLRHQRVTGNHFDVVKGDNAGIIADLVSQGSA